MDRRRLEVLAKNGGSLVLRANELKYEVDEIEPGKNGQNHQGQAGNQGLVVYDGGLL